MSFSLADIYEPPFKPRPTSIGMGAVLRVTGDTYIVAYRDSTTLQLTNILSGDQRTGSIVTPPLHDIHHLTRGEVADLLGPHTTLAQVEYLGQGYDVISMPE